MILPTLPEFEALSLPDREALFIAWVKEQPPEKVYVYYDLSECPLAQFGALIQRIPETKAGSHTFSVRDPLRRVDTLIEYGKAFNRLAASSTFGDLAASLS